ncbi:unnamed protein product, partial [Staurois parvus]
PRISVLFEAVCSAYFAFVADCGRSASESQRIVGGSPSAWGRWPWVASLRWDGRHVCGGSIISSQWVMSAAHCFVLSNFLTVGRWKVHVGFTSLNPSTTVSIRSIYYNGLYNPETNDFDVALIKTSQPMAFSETLRPVCLPRTHQEFEAKGNCWISGWGHVSEDPGQLSPVLREAKVHLISRNICNQSSHYPGMISERMLCAGYLDGKVDSCQGDSGGPLVCQEGGLWWQVGIVSWGEGCGRPNRPGVYTNLTVLLDWVYHRLQVSDQKSSGGELCYSKIQFLMLRVNFLLAVTFSICSSFLKYLIFLPFELGLLFLLHIRLVDTCNSLMEPLCLQNKKGFCIHPSSTGTASNTLCTLQQPQKKKLYIYIYNYQEDVSVIVQ